MAKCIKCQEEKLQSEFDFRRDTQKHEKRCKTCRKENNRSNYNKIKPLPRKLKTKICGKCNKDFLQYPVIDGVRYKATNREYCFECVPHKKRQKIKIIPLTKTCSKCNTTKNNTEEFFRTAKDRSSNICRECESIATKKQQRERKLKCLEYKGGKCQKCGYNKSPRSLHFHHIDPSNKDFTLGSYRGRSWEQIKSELDKCDLVCANCHGELHDENFKSDDFVSLEII